MGLEKIKNYFDPKSILDIGANVGQFYNEIKSIFPSSYYYLIEGNDSCEVVLESLNVDYSICLLSDIEKEVDFYVRKHELRCTGNSIYRENTSFYDDDQIVIEKKQTKTLSNLLGEKTFDLIKIDVESAEYYCLRSLSKKVELVDISLKDPETFVNAIWYLSIYSGLFRNKLWAVKLLGI